MSLKIELEVQEVQIVLAGLAKLPLENSIDVFLKLRSQAEAGMRAQAAEAEAAADFPPNEPRAQ